MRTIQYIPKDTKATTQYRTLKPEDKRYIFERLEEIIDFHKACKISKQDITIWKLVEPNTNLPKQGLEAGYRRNSILSAAKGVLSNFTTGTQYDFSEKTCNMLKLTFEEMEKIIGDSWETIQFVEVANFRPTVKRITENELGELFG